MFYTSNVFIFQKSSFICFCSVVCERINKVLDGGGGGGLFHKVTTVFEHNTHQPPQTFHEESLVSKTLEELACSCSDTRVITPVVMTTRLNLHIQSFSVSFHWVCRKVDVLCCRVMKGSAETVWARTADRRSHLFGLLDDLNVGTMSWNTEEPSGQQSGFWIKSAGRRRCFPRRQGAQVSVRLVSVRVLEGGSQEIIKICFQIWIRRKLHSGFRNQDRDQRPESF